MRLDCRRKWEYVANIGSILIINQSYRKGIEMDLSDLPPFDESVSGRALTPGAICQRGQSAAVSGPNLVQSNMTMELLPGRPDIQAIRRRAEAMRAAYVRSRLDAVWAAIETWFARRQQRELESYLADSQSLAELESRMRRYASRRMPFGCMGPDYD
jgi:hypothetical protein